MTTMRILDKIGSIEFKIMSPELIRSNAVVNVVNPELYDVDGYPIEGGLMDPRMGVIDPGIRCRTCGGKVNECPGHFGLIELARPVLHFEYIGMVYNMLRGTCKGCGRLLVDDIVKQKYENELNEVFENVGEIEAWHFVKKIVNRIKTKKSCPHCETPKEKITYEKPTRFYYGTELLTPIDIREWLEKLRSEDLTILGLEPGAGRPEWAILTVISVPPVTVRPSITLEGGQRSEDDLTHKLGDIVRTNQRLYENLNAGAPAPIIEDLWLLLQYHVTTFFDNGIAQIPPARHRSGRPLRTLTERLKGKEGRFRKNLAGKRVNFSARTVISPDSRVGIDEVGVPVEIARDLTIPERVTEWNLQYSRQLVNNAENYPGANYVITPDGKRKKVTEQTKTLIIDEMEPGYIVERHLRDDDIVLFNRQPSLHKMSIMGHRVRVLPGKTFRLNLAVTKPYNADFDGDEMNLHVPQTEEAQAEARLLMGVPQLIISPRHGTAIIGPIEDQISGCYILTRKETILHDKDAYKLLFKSGIETEFSERKEEYTGKEVFSLLLPSDFNYEGPTAYSKRMGNTATSDEDSYVVVKNGKLIAGAIDAASIGSGGKMIQAISNIYGSQRAALFIEQASMLGVQMLQERGFSMLLSDIKISQDLAKTVSNIKKEAIKTVSGLINDYKNKKLVAYPGRSLKETLELRIVSELNKARNQAVNFIGTEFKVSDNDTMVMVKTRAKGSLLNIGLMNAFNGQTSLRGSRISKGYYQRVLPHFERGDLGAKSHGFIENGFIHGLDPFEFFFVAITGRASLMDKSMATPKSGYLQRKLVNSLQDLKVVDDGSVRDDWNNVVQFIFGEDGIDVAKSFAGKTNIKSIINEVSK